VGISAQNQDNNDQRQIGMEEFKKRRLALLDSIGDGTAVLYSQGYEGDAGYRSDGNFWYLTGLDEPGAILVLCPEAVDREVLLLPPRDIEAERWTGIRPALSESLKVTWGFDRIYRIRSLDGLIVSRMKQNPTLHLISKIAKPSKDVPPDLEYYDKVKERIPGVKVENSSRYLESMRMIKTRLEITAIETAIQVTYEGLTELLASIKPGVKEFQLDGILEESFKKRGAQYMAFSPIVGAGEETTILHYEKRNQALTSGQLLLLDVGAEWDHYASDISRTLPIDGKFSAEQAKIYDIVLKAQNAAIAAIKPGITLREIDDIARDIIRQAGYADDFIHSTSHHLGLAVHDLSDSWMPLAPGMVITVEPGIYLPDLEIGVRIEDDILVTEKGHRILSAQIPRDRTAVEEWLAGERK
jgi:Xaa-Pro aminopeptidase